MADPLSNARYLIRTLRHPSVLTVYNRFIAPSPGSYSYPYTLDSERKRRPPRRAAVGKESGMACASPFYRRSFPAEDRQGGTHVPRLHLNQHPTPESTVLEDIASCLIGKRALCPVFVSSVTCLFICVAVELFLFPNVDERRLFQSRQGGPGKLLGLERVLAFWRLVVG